VYQYNIQEVYIVEIYAVMTVFISKLTQTDVLQDDLNEVVRVGIFPIDSSTQVDRAMDMESL
jgi:hypothetical protein